MAEKPQKRGLGSGLGALFGDTAVGEELSDTLSVRIEKVEPRADQPRKSFDEEALAELSDSIARLGVIQPITVRRLSDGFYQIIAGERRWRAARLAGLQEVPIRILEADDQRAMELALVENLQREDLNPIEEAKGYKTLIEEYKMTQETVSESVGKSRPAVANAMRLLSLPESVLAMVEDGRLSAGHARALLAIKDELKLQRAAEKVTLESLSVRQTEKLAAKTASEQDTEPEETAKRDSEVDYTAEAEKMLSEAMGRGVHIKDNRKKGKIELDYYGADDREELIRALLRFGGKGGDSI